MKANSTKLPADCKHMAYSRPHDEVLLPTGAKLYYYPGRGYYVHGYTKHDTLPYV